MKSFVHSATGKYRRKYDTQNFSAKYWATMSIDGEKRLAPRSDGAVATDKTAGFKSRPAKKRQLRQANRSLKKTARQALKKQMSEDRTG